MADNVTADAGSGGAVFATDDISSVHYPWVKLMVGAADSVTALSGGNGATDAGTIRVTVSSDSTGVLSVDDNGSSITVDGTVTANLSATDNAVLDSIDAALAGTLTVGSHAVTNAGTFAVQEDGAALTALQLIDDTVYVDDADWTAVTSKHGLIGGVYQSTPGTITDGDTGPLRMTANGAAHVAVQNTVTVDLGANNDVTLATLPDTAGGDLAAINAALAGTLTVGSHAVTNAGTFAVQESGAALTALQLIDNGVYIDDADWTATSSSHYLIGGVYQSTPGTITDGDTGPLRVNTNGALHVSIESDSVGIGGGTQYTEDVATANPIVGTATMMERDDIISTLTPIEGDWAAMRCSSEGALWVQDFNSDANAANLSAILADTANMDTNIGTLAGAVSGTEMQVDVLTMPSTAVTNAGTFAVQEDGAALTALQLIDNPIVAHDAAVSGSTGVTVAGFEARATEPTAVADADATRGITTLLGKQVVAPYTIPASSWSYAAASGGITNTTGVTAKAAAGAGIRNYVTRAQIVNGHASTGTDVQIRDGASGTVLWRGWAESAGGGVTAVFDPPLRGTANTLIEIACGTTGTATYINLQGFVAAE